MIIKNNPHFDIDAAIRTEAEHAAAKNANALLVLNTSPIVDNILFNKNDSAAALKIPVIYITAEGLKKYFPDLTNTYNIKLKVLLSAKKTHGKKRSGLH